MARTLIIDIENEVRRRLADWPERWEGYHWPGYTWEHTLRVRSLALRLADELGAERTVVELAALLHDVEKRAGRDHAWAGAIEARRLLDARGVNEDLIRGVVYAIDTHAGGNTPEHPVENLALGDADLIDANFGLVGVWRFITIRAGHAATVEETIRAMPEWLVKKDALFELLTTDAGRAIAEERIRYMHRFCTELVSALSDGEAQPGLMALVRHINANCERGSIFKQLPMLRRIAAEAGHERARAAVERLASEAIGRA